MGRPGFTVRPVTIKRTAPTSITNGNERSSETSPAAIDGSTPLRIMSPDAPMPQRIRTGLIRLVAVVDQRSGGRGRQDANVRPSPQWYTTRNQTSAQHARAFAAV